MSSNVVEGSSVNGEAQYLRANRLVARALPHPDETWHRATAPPLVAETISKLLANHIIEIAVRHGAPTDHNAHLYRTRESAYRYATECLDDPTTLDCGHTGIRNLGGGEYTCGREGCPVRVDRATAREVLSG